MNILLATPMPPQAEATGATPLVLYAELVGLLSRHAVTLATVAGQEPGEQEAVDRLSQDGVDVQAVRRTTPAGLNRWRRRWRMGSTWLRGYYPWRTVWFWEPELQAILDRLLASGRYDLVIAEDSAMGIYNFQPGTPSLFTEHEVRRPRRVNWRFWKQGYWFTPHRLLSWLFGEMDWVRWRRYQPDVWRKFDRVQVFTRRDAQAIERQAPDLMGSVEVNPFGIELPKPADPARMQEKEIVFVGNYAHQPNVDAALWLGREIMPLIGQACPGVHLTLVGIYPPAEVLALAGEDIHVTGAVPSIRPYLEQAAVVLAPVRIGGGMRVKVLKSMSLGKAVVTTPRGAGGLEVAGSRPPVGIAEGAPEFARLTAQLLSDRPARLELGQQAREFVVNYFSPQAYAGRIEAIYERMQPEKNRAGKAQQLYGSSQRID
jgi:glycosyltransferase involved in cell wall biosynthesis